MYFFLVHTPRPNRRTDLYAEWLKRRVSARAVWHVFKKPRFLRFFKNLKSPNLGFKKNKKPNVRFKVLSFISLIMQLI